MIVLLVDTARLCSALGHDIGRFTIASTPVLAFKFGTGRVDIWSETKIVDTLMRNGVVLMIAPIRSTTSPIRHHAAGAALKRIGLGGLSGVAITFNVVLGFAQTEKPAPAPSIAQGPTAKATKTLKERLSDKASDEQRVDDCKVPADRRGSKPRPDRCE
jgi:hypothetical protein